MILGSREGYDHLRALWFGVCHALLILWILQPAKFFSSFSFLQDPEDRCLLILRSLRPDPTRTGDSDLIPRSPGETGAIGGQSCLGSLTLLG